VGPLRLVENLKAASGDAINTILTNYPAPNFLWEITHVSIQVTKTTLTNVLVQAYNLKDKGGTPFRIFNRTPGSAFLNAPSAAGNETEVQLPIWIDKDYRVGVVVDATVGETIDFWVRIQGWEYAVEY